MLQNKDFIFTGNLTSLPDKTSFSWKSPSNIALIKYWGKTDPQMPKNASISFTLTKSYTETKVYFTKNYLKKKSDISVTLDGQKMDSFVPKIEQFLERINYFTPYLSQYNLEIITKNSFPHSSGIASSASGMSALALCIMSLEKELNPFLVESFFKQKASFLARLGSGSACRSVEGELVVWGKHKDIDHSSDLFGIKFSEETDPVFQAYQDCILLVDKGEKVVSSTVGHNLMIDHPYAEQRFNQANQNLARLVSVLKSGDLENFISIVESEALSLHAMMLTSNPYFILMKPNTLKVIEKIWRYRKDTGVPVCFTLDAGANVHVLYPKKWKEDVNQFIELELAKYCQNNHMIWDQAGMGAAPVSPIF
ncbi:diphosphomevalonate decarboxylase [Namhaeicola litoreus]|uniref:diphosphomevalonate decarboxylase n=1 Tax=Namhaeicola litoreus TaxID=1052145 RepID=A0ABW3Y073_9FLAO